MISRKGRSIGRELHVVTKVDVSPIPASDPLLADVPRGTQSTIHIHHGAGVCLQAIVLKLSFAQLHEARP
jgi:hypothetical protein